MMQQEVPLGSQLVSALDFTIVVVTPPGCINEKTNRYGVKIEETHGAISLNLE